MRGKQIKVNTQARNTQVHRLSPKNNTARHTADAGNKLSEKHAQQSERNRVKHTDDSTGGKAG